MDQKTFLGGEGFAILFERSRVISIIHNIMNMKMFFIYNNSEHGDAVISSSRIIFFNVLTIVRL